MPRSNSGKLKVELHLHTSADPVDNLPLDIVETLHHAARLGFDAIAVTHHESVFVPDEAALEASERTGVLLIPGIEASLDGGAHVLILGCGPEMEEVRTLEELSRVKQPHHLVIPAHPFYPGGVAMGLKGLLEPWVHLFDAVEWSHFWHPWLEGPNLRAAEFAERHQIPLVGTGDVHLPDQMGHTYTLVEAEKTQAAIIAAIKEGRTEVITRPLELLHMAWIAARLLVRNHALNPRLWRRLRPTLRPSRSPAS
jgi:predicted metal-dependent phosphoesterase TrpH